MFWKIFPAIAGLLLCGATAYGQCAKGPCTAAMPPPPMAQNQAFESPSACQAAAPTACAAIEFRQAAPERRGLLVRVRVRLAEARQRRNASRQGCG